MLLKLTYIGDAKPKVLCIKWI